MTKPFLRGFLLLACLLTLVLPVTVSAESPGVIVTISSDTTWAKANSPHTFTGPLLVKEGVTLTIDAGVLVDFNGYYMRVDGALQARGSDSARIRFSNGDKIEFTSKSDGWDEPTKSGSILEYVTLEDVNIVSDTHLKITNLSPAGGYSGVEAKSLVLLDSNFARHVYAGGDSIIQNNTLNVFTITDGSPVITNNNIKTIYGSGSSPVISNNTLGSIGRYIYGSNGNPEYTYLNVNSVTISNNVLTKGVYVIADLDATISSNRITGFSDEYTFITTQRYTTFGIILKGDGHITGNIITGCASGISGGTVIEENLLLNTIDHGITVLDRGNVVVRNNNVTNSKVGICCDDCETLTIENNFVCNQSFRGLSVHSPATIQNNTIRRTEEAINLYGCPSATVRYNNLESYSNNSIVLGGTSGDINAINNWWGTTDTQEINFTIYDNKYEFDIGKVTFVPILNEPNPQATPTSNPVIPEFPSWIVLPLLLILFFSIIVFKKRMHQRIGRYNK